MEIASGVITPVVESLMRPIKKHLGYLISCTKHVRNMSTKMGNLDARRRDVENQIGLNGQIYLNVPTRVSDWLKEVGNINEEVESINGSDINSCFDLRRRYKMGRKAFMAIQKIDDLISENLGTDWIRDLKTLGKVDSKKAPTSAPTSHYVDFKSRELVFEEALEALQSDQKTHMIALCGMGGVGKTTMMRKLEKAVKEKKMFDYTVKAVIGEKTDPIALQKAMADYLGLTLTEETKEARADRLRQYFEAKSDGGKTKILVILYDIWHLVDLNDIGLSPFPNQCVGFKFLLTARDENVCLRMGAKFDSIFKVKVLEDSEAQNFFRRYVDDDDLDELGKIGEEIVRRCGGLPIAIEIIALNLKGKGNDVWKDALFRLHNHDLHDNLQQIFQMSFDNLKEETKAIFLLCGLFPDDFNIVIEDLMRYGWGLKLFSNVYNLREARSRLSTCIDELICAHLLIKSDDPRGCVKMHDLLRDYVLSISRHESIVNHGDTSKWDTEDTTKSYKRVSLTCTGMSAFPREFSYPNLLLLKLMNGDESLKFAQDFYGRMEQLQVIDYERMQYPMLPGSLRCSTNLRTLRLHSCSLVYDLSHIGNLLNLEILSFARCEIQKLPSTIGNLKKLKLLDVTGCIDLKIDDGILGNLHQLEELYMRVYYSRGVRFTDTNYDELKTLSKKLFALEVEFFKKKALPNNVSLKQLERFKISMGCYLDEYLGQDWERQRWMKNRGYGLFVNTLMLVTNKDELLKSRINELFPKTKVLRLHVEDLNDLEDILEPLESSPFQNLRVLSVSDCARLKFLFSFPVAQGLSKLERLEVSSCPVLEEIVHLDDNEAEMIGFKKLVYLSLERLPKLESLCRDVDVIELPELVELALEGLPNFSSIYQKNKSTTSSMFGNIPTVQPFFNEKAVIPKLERLDIWEMENLKEIWPCQFSGNEGVNICTLKRIDVIRCDRLVNLFPTNPMPLLHHLENLGVWECSSIKAIFNMDLGCVHEIEERSSSSSLRLIDLYDLENLREVWRMKDVNKSHHIIHDFRAVETIQIIRCKRFRNVFTPTTANFDLGAIKKLKIDCGKPGRAHGINDELAVESSTNTDDQQQIGVVLNEDIMEMDDDITDVIFPYHLMPTFLISQQRQQSSFCNLAKICIEHYGSIKYLFSPHMAKLLFNLKKVEILNCDSMEEVVSKRDDIAEEISTSTHTNTAFFPHLDSINLEYLQCLERIDTSVHGRNTSTYNDTNTYASIHDQFQCAQVYVPSWSLCQYSKSIAIRECKALSCVIPSHLVGQPQKVEELRIEDCGSMVELFETKQVNYEGIHVDGGSEGTNNILTIPRQMNTTLLELSNLKILKIVRCNLLRHIFMSSTLESLMQLKELEIEDCKAMQVIVKEEDGEHTTTSKLVVFPRLQSLKLVDLPDVKGFFFGKNDFEWPSLDKVTIDGCPEMMMFTFGHSNAPKLYYMHTSLGKHSLECGLNFHFTTALQETQFHTSNPCPAKEIREPHQFPWSFSNLIEVNLLNLYRYPPNRVRIVFPCNELLNLQNLEKVHVSHYFVDELFEVEEGTNDDVNKTQSFVRYPKLKDLTLERLYGLKYMWKVNKWTILEFPGLTKLSIEGCNKLEHVFTCTMVGSLLQLQELHISFCSEMEVIVKEEEEEETKMKGVVFPCLKSLTLVRLPNLKGFCLTNEDFTWQSLDTLKIEICPKITVFTNGHATTSELKNIDTTFGRCYIGEDLNSFIKTKRQEGLEF